MLPAFFDKISYLYTPYEVTYEDNAFSNSSNRMDLFRREWEHFPNINHLQTIRQEKTYVEFIYKENQHESLRYEGVLLTSNLENSAPPIVYSFEFNWLLNLITLEKYKSIKIRALNCQLMENIGVHRIAINVNPFRAPIYRKVSDFKGSCSQCPCYNDFITTNNCCKFKE